MHGAPNPQIAPSPSARGLPAILPPIPARRILLKADTTALPRGARAHWPTHDGDPFLVNLSPRSAGGQSVAEVSQNTVRPVLTALGFTGGRCVVEEPEAPVPYPRATVSALARAWEHEYLANPALARPGTRLVFDALTRRAPSGAADALVSVVEGATVDGLTARLERQLLLYVFGQRCDGVVVEHVAVVASGWAGETINTVQGSILTSPVIADNLPGLTPARAVDAARGALAALDPAVPPRALTVEDGPAHVLLPYGGAADGRIVLRHAYRLELKGEELFPVVRARRDQLAHTLSGGEQQMVAIARGLMARPRLLMVDEPFLGLAPHVVTEIGQLIRRIRDEEGIGVVFIEQNVELALRLADRGYVLESGRTILHGPSAELLQSPEVKRIFLGDAAL